MKLSDLQQEVQEFVEQTGVETSVELRVLDIASELGELAKEVLKNTDYGNRAFVGNDEWANELGDVLFSLICVANTTGVDLEKSLSAALDKYQRRFEKKGRLDSK